MLSGTDGEVQNVTLLPTLLPPDIHACEPSSLGPKLASCENLLSFFFAFPRTIAALCFPLINAPCLSLIRNIVNLYAKGSIQKCMAALNQWENIIEGTIT